MEVPLKTTPVVVRSPKLLYMSIFAVVLAFLPVLCVGGAGLGFVTLRKALATKDTMTQVLSIIALIVGALVSVQTIFMVLVLMQWTGGSAPDFR